MNLFKVILGTVCLLLVFQGAALSGGAGHPDGGHWSSSRPDGHAPIGVMGEHTHKKGEWMVSYRFMRMDMEDHRTGNDKTSDAQVLKDFPITPTSMSMDMHMLGVMYAPSDTFTIMGMIPYVTKSMDHLRRNGLTFNTKAQGIGDIKLTGLYALANSRHQQVHLNAGVSLPSGSIDEKDTTPAGPGQKLPYPMQIGSGTVDFLPGITYLGQGTNWSWGAQALANLRFYDNANDYHLGDEYTLTAWTAYRWAEWVSTSMRIETTIWDDIDGADPDVSPTIVPTGDPGLRGGKRVDLLFGINMYRPQGRLKGYRIAFEAGFPLYQYLEGPQLGVDFQSTVGWQAVF